AKSDADQQFLELAKRSLACHSRRIGCELANGLDIGGEPGQAMGGTLLAVEQTADHAALHRDLCAYLCCRLRQQRIEGCIGLAGELDQIGFSSRTGCSSGHRKLADKNGRQSHTTRALHKSKVAREFRLLNPAQPRKSL